MILLILAKVIFPALSVLFAAMSLRFASLENLAFTRLCLLDEWSRV